MSLKIDPELKALIPPLTPEEHAELRASLQAEGCRDKLIAWGDVIIDGHNRFELCAELGIPYEVDRREFESRDHAIVWMARNQLARRNMPQIVRDWLVVDALKPALERINKERMAAGGSKSTRINIENTEGSAESAEPSEAHNTDAELAKSAGTSERGVRQSAFVKEKAPEVVKRAAVDQDISRNRAYEITRLLQELPAEYRDRAALLSIAHENKVKILVRLYESAGSPETNGTFFEILSTGGFHYGDDLDKWCDFANDSVEQIEAALKSLAKHHAREARQNKQAERAEIAQNLPPTVFNVLYADPAWEYSNTGIHGAAESHYQTMPTDDICAMLDNSNVQIAKDAILFMWVTNPLLPDAMRVLDAWGFEYKTNMAWHKTDLVKPGGGFYVRGWHELLFIATRGSMTPLVDVSPPIGSVIVAPVQEHSRKPDELYDIIERLYPGCNYLELFARQPRDGWVSWGDEVRHA